MTRISDWRIVTDSRDRLGESPQWNAATGELFWIDFYGPTVHCLGPEGRRRDWTLAGFDTIGSLVLCEEAKLLVAMDRGLFLFDPSDGSLAAFADPNRRRAEIGYNDSKVDRHGRYWVGTFDATESAPRGILYALTAAGDWQVGDSGFVVCNGPAVSPSGDVLYFNDSIGRQTLAYDLNAASGALTRRRVFHRYAEADGLPDGLCVDRAGHVWCALYGGGRIVRLSPGGERVESLSLPVPNVTSCCFGGPDLRTLFATTGVTADGAADEGGALFAANLDVQGLPEPLFRPARERTAGPREDRG